MDSHPTTTSTQCPNSDNFTDEFLGDMTSEDGKDDDLDPGSYDENDSPAELEELMSSILSSAEQYGPAINSKVATRFEGLLNREFTKEDAEKLKATFLPPENAPLLGIPRIHPALWNSLPVKARSIDAKLQDTQRKVNQAFIGTAQIMDMMEQNWKMIPKEIRTVLITKVLNISKSLAMSVKELSQQRRLALRPFLRKEVTTVGNNLSPSANFLGTNWRKTSEMQRQRLA